MAEIIERHKPAAKKALAAALVKRLWRLCGFESPTELVLEDLAYAMGILVLDAPLEGADAWLLRKGNAGIIRISNLIWESGRRRFAVAHELGHWSMHEKISQVFACTDDDMISQYKSSVPEIEANCFAAELLMPRHLFSACVANSPPTASIVNDLAEKFGTTRTATAIRIADVSKDYFAVIACRDGVIKWWYATEPLREKIWIDVGTPVPRYSVAGRFHRGELLPAGPEKVDLASWFPETRGLYDDYVFEDVIPMPSYGQILSLLWLR